MNSDQAKAMFERILYGVLMFGLMKLVAKGYISADDAGWIAGGIVSGLGAVWAWWKSRPATLLNRAQTVLPTDTKLDVVPAPAASVADLNRIASITNAANENVTAKLAA